MCLTLKRLLSFYLKWEVSRQFTIWLILEDYIKTMKKNRIKIAAILLFILQLALGVKSFLIVRKIAMIETLAELTTVDRLLLFAGFLAGVLISLVLIILVFSSFANVESSTSSTEEEKKMEKKRKAKKKGEKEEVNETSYENKQVLEKLNLELSDIDQVDKLSEKILINISKVYDIMQGVFFVKDPADKVFRKAGAYAYYNEDELREFTEEVGLSGQVAVNKKLLNISNIPEKYITVLSGLGKSSPANLLIIPVVYNDESIGIIELASFKKFDSFAEETLTDFTNQISGKLSELNKPAELSTK